MHRAVAVSTAVHVAVVAWAITREGPRPAPPSPPAAVPIEIVPAPARPRAPAPPPPLAVAIVDLAAWPTTRTTPARPPPGPRPTPAARAAAIAPGRDTATEIVPDPAPGRAEPSPLLGMRGRRVDLALPPGYRDDLDRAPTGTAPARTVEPTGQLRSSGSGTHRSNQGVFTARVAPDGSVDLQDARNLDLRLTLPRPAQLGEGLATWYQSDKGADGKRGITALDRAIQRGMDPRTTGQAEDRGDRAPSVIVPVGGGGFDVTDWLMRGKKQDPYAARKLAFLDATRAERVQIGKRHRAAQLRQTAQLVRRNLERVWAATPDPAARKRALFELWDEIADAPADDALLAEATAAARAQVIGFIRARLPRGSTHAYTPGEIAALARRQHSAATFAPY